MRPGSTTRAGAARGSDLGKMRMPNCMLALPAMAAVLSFLAPPAHAASATTRPARLSNGWPAGLYDFNKPERLVVQESTPTPQQVDWTARPPQTTDREEVKPDVAAAATRP